MTSAHQMASRPPATKQAATGTRSWRQDDLLADAVAQTGRGQGDWRLVQVWPQGHGVGLAGRWRYASRWSLPATWQLRRTRPLPATRTNRRLVVTATSSCASAGQREHLLPTNCDPRVEDLMGVAGQAAAWKRTRAWLARLATRSGPNTAGSWRSMLGSRRAATTGTPFMITLPQGTWAP